MAGLSRSEIPADVRRLVFYRDCNRCCRCGRELSFRGRNSRGRKVPKPTFHHILAKADGGTNAIENIKTLCPGCHRIVDGNERKRRRR